MNVCLKIRKRRVEMGYSQEYMAIQLGVSQKTYSRIENEQSKIDLKKLLEIAKILETSAFYFINADDTVNNKKGYNNILNNKDTSIERKQYERMIELLEVENSFLKETIKRLTS